MVSLQSKGLVRPLIEFSGRLTQIHVPTLVLGLGMFLLLRLLRSWSPRSPGPLLAVIVGTSQHLLAVLMGVRVLARVRPERALLNGAIRTALSFLDGP
jgi:SulP family sulfate permease